MQNLTDIVSIKNGHTSRKAWAIASADGCPPQLLHCGVGLGVENMPTVFRSKYA